MVRAVTTRQSGRAEPYRKGNPDGPGAWKHDMHDAVKQSLASRISGASRPGASRSQSGSGGSSLAARLSSGPSAKGRELISSGSSSSSKAPTPKLHGFDAPVPVNTNANLNAGVELFPTRAKRTSGSVLDSRVVASGIAAAGLGQQRVQRQQQRTVPLQTQYAEPTAHTSSVSIFGAAKTSIVVRVENLAPGTTPDDVMSAFSSSPIISATEAPSQNKLVAIDLEFSSRGPADELVAQYNGVVADGNTLRLGIIRASLSERMGRQAQLSRPTLDERRTPSGGAGARRELVAAPGSGKMFSDTILASDPTSAVITVASDSGPAANRQRADAWARNAPAPRSNAGGSLAGRIGGSRGRGQARGGDMMVD